MNGVKGIFGLAAQARSYRAVPSLPHYNRGVFEVWLPGEIPNHRRE